MEQILEILKSYPKEVITYIVLKLMEDNVLSFDDVAIAHTQYLEMLRKGQSEKLMNLRSKVIDLWCSDKKDIGHNLVNLMQEARDNGWANISQEQINNSKWNK